MQTMPNWPTRGIAIEGDFSGIQRFVFRPIPGARGAARRLRARSFRVLALTRLVAEAVQSRFRESQAHIFYWAGGRFLVVANPYKDWKNALKELQQDLDAEFLRMDKGELIFHLAGAEFQDEKIPVAKLHEEMQARKQRPLAGVLCPAGAWDPERFVFAASQPAKCDGCGATASLRDLAEGLCDTCVNDRELGAELLRASRVTLKESSAGAIALLGQEWSICDDGPVPISMISHTPIEGGQLATFEDLSARAKGRPYLAFLRIDADHVGRQFDKFAGEPRQTWELSDRLNRAFSYGVSTLLRTRFQNLYPVYGGGDDLFVIGPWNDVIDFASAWRSEFRKPFRDTLTFSAGVALAKPREHILTKSEEAELVLNDHAKGPRDSIHVLGTTIPFSDLDVALECARKVVAMINAGTIKHSLLHNISELQDRWQRGESGQLGSDARKLESDARWHSLLFYQLERNVAGEAKSYLRDAFLSPGHLWKYAGFVARYAMLSTGREERS